MTNNLAKPFLKWAGGKTQLLPIILDNLPNAEDMKHIDTYVEPFIGGGAVFFELIKYYKFKNIVINDYNIEVASAYICIRDCVEDLISELRKLESVYQSYRTSEEKSIFYYKIREAFNYEKNSIDYNVKDSFFVSHISKLIFLNKTCFNGLYRLNSKGGFNVPFGDYQNPHICDEGNLNEVNKVLQSVNILSGDFEIVGNYITNNTLVYLDPPYRPLSGTSSFNSYAKESFNDSSQRRLSLWYKILSERGAFLILSNSDPKNTNPSDNFFDDMYSQYTIQRVRANRNINSNAQKRGLISEILVTNFNRTQK